MSASPVVVPAFIRRAGDIFQPGPRSRAALAPSPSVARAPPAFSPVMFSALMDRERASDTRQRLPRCMPRPLNCCAISAVICLTYVPFVSGPPVRRERVDYLADRCRKSEAGIPGSTATRYFDNTLP